jgi:hypothetical protein
MLRLGKFLPPFSSLIELLRVQQRDNLVNLHQLPLFKSQVGIRAKLFMKPFAKLFPVEVPNGLFEKVFVQLVSLAEGIHVDFDEDLVLERFGKVEAALAAVVDLAEAAGEERVEHVILLHLKPCQIILIRPVLLRNFERLQQQTHRRIEIALLHHHLTLVE